MRFLHASLYVSVLVLTTLSCKIESNSGSIDPILELILQQLNEDPAAGGRQLTDPIYADLSAFAPSRGYWALQEHPTDEIYLPDRGAAWDDNGVWRALHDHSWTASHPFVEDTWNGLHSAIIRCGTALDILEQADPSDGINQLEAEVKALRAMLYSAVIDLFGQVQEFDKTQGLYVLDRNAALQVAITDLESAIPLLPGKLQSAGLERISRMNEYVARIILARLYLNRHVYQASGAPNTQDLVQAIANSSAVIASGEYALADDYWNMFGLQNSNNTSVADEAILVLPSDANGESVGSGQFIVVSSLHPGHFTQTNTWNGFATLADFYNSWDTTDRRFHGPEIDGTGLTYGFLEGPQFDAGGMPIYEADETTQVDYTLDCPEENVSESCGVRAIKYEPDLSGATISDADFVVIRLAEAYLMKAEAEYRIGTFNEALTTINTLRATRGSTPLAQVDEQALLAEYGFELWWEGHRRTQQIRFGTFNDPVTHREFESAATLQLFPIPLSALNSNPNLVQNPGY